MRFDVQYGMNPRAELDNLLIMSRTGQAEILIIGGKPLGVDKWALTELKQGWSTVDNRGNLLVGTAEVTLKEYISGSGG